VGHGKERLMASEGERNDIEGVIKLRQGRHEEDCIATWAAAAATPCYTVAGLSSA
jgi:hypothetical protein